MQVDLNLDTLRRDILAYLQAEDFVVFHAADCDLGSLPVVEWDSESYPDYQMFLGVARRVGVHLVQMSQRRLEESDVEEAAGMIEDCPCSREERREFEKRLKEFKGLTGRSSGIEISFTHDHMLYRYQVETEWSQRFLDLYDELDAMMPASGDDPEADSSMGPFFSNN